MFDALVAKMILWVGDLIYYISHHSLIFNQGYCHDRRNSRSIVNAAAWHFNRAVYTYTIAWASNGYVFIIRLFTLASPYTQTITWQQQVFTGKPVITICTCRGWHNSTLARAFRSDVAFGHCISAIGLYNHNRHSIYTALVVKAQI